MVTVNGNPNPTNPINPTYPTNPTNPTNPTTKYRCEFVNLFCIYALITTTTSYQLPRPFYEHKRNITSLSIISSVTIFSYQCWKTTNLKLQSVYNRCVVFHHFRVINIQTTSVYQQQFTLPRPRQIQTTLF